MQSVTEYQGEGTTVSYVPIRPTYTDVWPDEEPWVNPLSDIPRKSYSNKVKLKKKLKRKIQRRSRKRS